MHPAENSPTVAARLLANELRRLRIAAGLSQADVARELGCAQSRVGHFETRRTLVRRADLLVMLQLYKVPVERQVWYLDLVVKAKKKGWWDGAPGTPEWFSALVGLEWGASEIRAFELSVIPGLLQTRAYMEALFRVTPNRTEEQVQALVEYRLRRQDVLTRSPVPLRLHVMLDEAVLRRSCGGSQVMREQLRHLAELEGDPSVTIQVLPFAREVPIGLESSFYQLKFDVPADPGVVYLETRLGGLYLEGDNEIATYEQLFGYQQLVALDSGDSARFITQLAKDY